MSKRKISFPQNVIHELLECLRRVAQTEAHTYEYEFTTVSERKTESPQTVIHELLRRPKGIRTNS